MLGYRSNTVGESGKRKIVFSPTEGYVDLPVKITCGSCIGCRYDKARMWALRCMHEASLYEKNCFVTLTYNNESLPSDGCVHKDHLQKFMKRLRKKYGEGIRYYACGEYGEKLNRPHYHLCIFNFDFDDKDVLRAGSYSYWNGDVKVKPGGHRWYRSPSLEALWPFGYSSIGELTMESAGYVARYVTKKIVGDKRKEYYGNMVEEFALMSRNPGIGSDWIKKYKSDVYPKDFVTVNGRRYKPPRFYDSRLDEAELEEIKAERERRRKAKPEDSGVRLMRRAKAKTLQTRRLERGFENAGS